MLLWQLSPKWAPVIVFPAVLAALVKKALECYVYVEKQKAMQEAMKTYQQKQAETEFEQDTHSDIIH